MRRLLLRLAMAPLWAAISWKSYLPKLYAGQRPADFGEYRDQVVASLRRPGYARAFSLTTRTSHDPAEARLADVTAPVLVVMGEQDPDFPDPRAEADWIAAALRGRSRHGARGRALPAVAAARHHHRRRPALPGIGPGPCLGARLISFNTFTGHPPHPKDELARRYMPAEAPGPLPGVFPAGASFSPAGDSGFRQSSFSDITRVPQRTVPYAWARPLLSWHAIVPISGFPSRSVIRRWPN